MKYFDQLKEYSDSTVISIRHDIRQILQNYLLLAANSEIEFAALSSSFSSLFNCLASILKSSSFKKIKIMLKSKRETLIVTTIQNEKLLCRAIVLRHEMNKMIFRKQLKEKHIMNDFSKNRQLLFEQEETIILEFVNQYIKLKFFFRRYMIKEKAILLL
jgi:hypothetical protein